MTSIDLTDNLKNLGRRQHGLCGKDADLDYGGQIKVESAYYYETNTHCYIEAKVRPYASICHGEEYDFDSEEDFEVYIDLMTEIVCMSGWPGDYDGDYWVISMGEQTITLEWKEEEPPQTEEEKGKATRSLYDAIFKHCAGFQNDMTNLLKSMSVEKYKKEMGYHTTKKERTR